MTDAQTPQNQAQRFAEAYEKAGHPTDLAKIRAAFLHAGGTEETWLEGDTSHPRGLLFRFPDGTEALLDVIERHAIPGMGRQAEDDAKPLSSAEKFARAYEGRETTDLAVAAARYLEAGGTDEDYNELCDVIPTPGGFEILLSWPDGSRAVWYQKDGEVIVEEDI